MKKGGPATGPGQQCPVIHDKVGKCAGVGRARSLEPDRPGPTPTPLLTTSAIVGHFTPLHLSVHVCKTGTIIPNYVCEMK